MRNRADWQWGTWGNSVQGVLGRGVRSHGQWGTGAIGYSGYGPHVPHCPMGYRGLGHMGNGDTWGNRVQRCEVQGVWATWAMGTGGMGLWWGPTKAFCSSVNVYGMAVLFADGGDTSAL